MNVTQFYGTFNVRYTKVSDTGCDVTFATSGTFTIVGNTSGSDVRLRINERVEREYRGTMSTSGRFDGTSSGVILTGDFVDLSNEASGGPSDAVSFWAPGGHDYTGVLTGQVSGNSVSGSERITFGLGCPGNVVVLEIAGNK